MIPLSEHSRLTPRLVGRFRMRQSAGGLVMSTAVQAVLQSAFALLTARWLGPADRGVLALAVVTSALAALVGSLGIVTGARVILASPKWQVDWRSYWRVVDLVSLVHTATVTVAAAGSFYLVARGPSMLTVLGFAGYCALMMPAGLGREGLHGVGRHLRAALTDVYAAAIQLGLAFALYLTDMVTVPALLVCGCVGFLAQILITRSSGPHVGSRRRLPFKSALRLTRRVVAFSVPGIVLTVGQLIAWKGDRLILGIFAPPGAVGVYAVGATLADAAWILPTAVSVIVLRQVAATGSMRPLLRWRTPILVTTAIGALLLGTFTSLFIRDLLGDGYADSIQIVWILCFASIPFASQQIDLAACYGAHRLDVGAKIAVWGAVCLTVVSFALIPRYNSIGAAVASLVTYVLLAVLARRAVLRLDRQLSLARPSHIPVPDVPSHRER